MSETATTGKKQRQIMKLAGAKRTYTEFTHDLLDEPIILQSLKQSEKIQIAQNGKAARIGNTGDFDLQKLDSSTFQMARIVCLETDRSTPYFSAGDRELWGELPGEFVDALIKAIMSHTGLDGDDREGELAKN